LEEGGKGMMVLTTTTTSTTYVSAIREQPQLLELTGEELGTSGGRGEDTSYDHTRSTEAITIDGIQAVQLCVRRRKRRQGGGGGVRRVVSSGGGGGGGDPQWHVD